MVRRRMLLATLALASLVVAAPALAATDTGNLGVTVVLDGVCLINSAADLSFGDYTIDSLTNVAATASLVVTCTESEDYRVYMSQGQNYNVMTRRMVHDTQSNVFLEYDIYLEEEHTTRWGSEFGNNDHSGTGTGESQTITIYGLIPSEQTPTSVGNFADTVVVYLEW